MDLSERPQPDSHFRQGNCISLAPQETHRMRTPTRRKHKYACSLSTYFDFLRRLFALTDEQRGTPTTWENADSCSDQVINRITQRIVRFPIFLSIVSLRLETSTTSCRTQEKQDQSITNMSEPRTPRSSLRFGRFWDSLSSNRNRRNSPSMNNNPATNDQQYGRSTNTRFSPSKPSRPSTSLAPVYQGSASRALKLADNEMKQQQKAALKAEQERSRRSSTQQPGGFLQRESSRARRSSTSGQSPSPPMPPQPTIRPQSQSRGRSLTCSSDFRLPSPAISSGNRSASVYNASGRKDSQSRGRSHDRRPSQSRASQAYFDDSDSDDENRWGTANASYAMLGSRERSSLSSRGRQSGDRGREVSRAPSTSHRARDISTSSKYSGGAPLARQRAHSASSQTTASTTLAARRPSLDRHRTRTHSPYPYTGPAPQIITVNSAAIFTRLCSFTDQDIARRGRFPDRQARTIHFVYTRWREVLSRPECEGKRQYVHDVKAKLMKEMWDEVEE
jgi:hypothetical protein